MCKIVVASINLYAYANSVIKFNRQNHVEWYEQIQFTPGMMTLDHVVVTEDDPSTITHDISKTEFWERSKSWAEPYKNDDDRKFCNSCSRQSGQKLQKIKECSCTELTDKSIVGSPMSANYNQVWLVSR